jgi:hypothetical protein
MRGEVTMMLLVSINKGRGVNHTLVEVGITGGRVHLGMDVVR